MARKEIQHTVLGRTLGLSVEGWLVANLPDKTQIVVSPAGVLLTDASNNTTTVSGTGTGVALSVPYATTIPLDTTGSGKAMVETTLSASSVFTASGATEGGNCTLTLVGDGLHIPDLSAFQSGNGYAYNYTLAARNIYVFVREYGSNVYYGSLIGASGSGIAIPFSTTIPLDTPAEGKYMPSTAIISNLVFVAGPTVEQGNCNFALVGDGTHIPDLSAFVNANNYAYVSTAGANNIYSAVATYGTVMLFGSRGTDNTAAVPPTLVSATVQDATATRIDLVWSKPINSTVSAASAFAVSSGHTLTSHVYDTPTTSHLLTSASFIAAEAKTLAYTQPGTNNMRDLSANLVANFSGAAITNNCTVPTLISAAVANATPTHIDLTWSKSINSTVSASSAFTVSAGHTLTAHTYVDATHSFLTTSVAFAVGETKTLAYAQPGSNKMQDTNGTLVAGFSGTAIADGVTSATGTLTESAPSIGTTLDLNAGGYRDYYFARNTTGVDIQKTGRPFIAAPTFTNCGFNATLGTWPTLAATDWVVASSGAVVGAYSGSDARDCYQLDVGIWGAVFTLPAGTSAQTLRVHFGAKRWDLYSCPGRCKLTVTLSDGSASPLTITTATPTADLQYVTERHDIVFASAASAQTLTLTFEAAAGNTTGDIVSIELLALV